MTGGARRVALVTGAASGIGAAIAARLARGGFTVAGLDRAVAADVALAVQADVTDRAAVEAAVARVVAELGPIEVLVTAAGSYEVAPIDEIDGARFARMLRIHLGGTMHACAAVVPAMRAAGRGCIVTISSELALAGGDREVHYAAAKGAIVGLSRSLGAELAPHGIRVTSVAPGPTDTPLLAADSPWRAPEYLATLPLGRLVRPEEIAETVGFLVEEGTFFTGTVVSPNAGAVI
ncbi:SDR family NAD(P)-dependent oxidoreductase [Patulibacter defluvii]|uniref:SDR family NAD(P)-dependent oxidoreductase n=1 Tax=Patulibacter defluvii TaxID=3095358 RepID=UPI002A75DFF0|nr:SDR family oxidoreductase [Patulibacter sp. DM4]